MDISLYICANRCNMCVCLQTDNKSIHYPFFPTCGTPACFTWTGKVVNVERAMLHMPCEGPAHPGQHDEATTTCWTAATTNNHNKENNQLVVNGLYKV